jgi:hypothetical protein
VDKMTEHTILVNIFGVLLIATSILDALKYELEARRIIEAKTSKNRSRKFINWALLNDVIKFGYGIVILDFYIILTSVLSLITMCRMFYAQYLFYPYKYRGLTNFKRPSLFVYIINSWMPNSLRRKL